MKAIYSDGGRSTSSHKDERWDCAVRALAIATGMKYDDCYDLLKSCGRKKHGGVTSGEFEAALNHTFIPWVKRGGNFQKVQYFANDITPGIVILDTYVEFRGKKYDHLCTVIDGIIYDKFLPYDQRVNAVYHINQSR